MIAHVLGGARATGARLVGCVGAFLQASTASGRPAHSLLAEWLRLRFRRGRIGFSEYLDFRLFRADLDLESKTAFGGRRAQQALEELLVDAYSRILTLDKVTAHLFLSGLGLPVPRLFAVFGNERRPGPFEALADERELSRFFSTLETARLYVKPAFGVKGKGNFSIVESDSAGVRTLRGDRLSFAELARRLSACSPFGWMLQENLAAHPTVAERCGVQVSGLRLNVFLGSGEPRILRATWKVNVGGDTDNFDSGRSGNLVAAVDANTGIVTRVIAGLGLAQREVDVHPVTGRELVGMRLPLWGETLQLVERAARAIPGFICQGWDIALCDRGPVVLEINDFGDLDLVQAAHDTGFLDDRFMQMLRDARLEALFAGPAKRHMRDRRNGRLGRRASHWRW